MSNSPSEVPPKSDLRHLLAGARQQIERGEGIPHDEVRHQAQRWRPDKERK